MTITFKIDGVSDELLRIDDDTDYQVGSNKSLKGLILNKAEALQVRDELLRRYPLTASELGSVVRKMFPSNETLYSAGATNPKPTPPALKLEVGRWYLRRDGLKVEITQKQPDVTFPFSNGFSPAYTSTGLCSDPQMVPGSADLIAETTAPGVMEVEGCSIGDVSTTQRQTPLAVGDTVRLKSGGPVMTVARVFEENVRCEWFKGSESRWDVFKVAALVRAKP